MVDRSTAARPPGHRHSELAAFDLSAPTRQVAARLVRAELLSHAGSASISSSTALLHCGRDRRSARRLSAINMAIEDLPDDVHHGPYLPRIMQ